MEEIDFSAPAQIAEKALWKQFFVVLSETLQKVISISLTVVGGLSLGFFA
jgi:hypothetical protein